LSNSLANPLIFTIGHSTHPLPEFIALLQAYDIAHLVDIRTVPRSRYNPQFNRETLPEALKLEGIDYLHMSGLGGLRHTRTDSPNLGLRNASFRGYADYMQTPEFAQAVTQLIAIAAQMRTALMCAEAVPWRCHRNLLSDALVVRGIRVEHIMSKTATQHHELTSFAHVEGETITYPEQKPTETQQRLL
jgi:uncharacterized protein (DUF488 family)